MFTTQNLLAPTMLVHIIQLKRDTFKYKLDDVREYCCVNTQQENIRFLSGSTASCLPTFMLLSKCFRTITDVFF